MSVRFLVPTQLRRLTAGASEVEVEASTVGEAIEALEAAHPGFKAQMLDGDGLKRFVNVYLSDEDVRYLDGLATPVADGDTVTIIAAVAGG